MPSLGRRFLRGGTRRVLAHWGASNLSHRKPRPALPCARGRPRSAPARAAVGPTHSHSEPLHARRGSTTDGPTLGSPKLRAAAACWLTRQLAIGIAAPPAAARPPAAVGAAPQKSHRKPRAATLGRRRGRREGVEGRSHSAAARVLRLANAATRRRPAAASEETGRCAPGRWSRAPATPPLGRHRPHATPHTGASRRSTGPHATSRGTAHPPERPRARRKCRAERLRRGAGRATRPGVARVEGFSGSKPPGPRQQLSRGCLPHISPRLGAWDGDEHVAAPSRTAQNHLGLGAHRKSRAAGVNGGAARPAHSPAPGAGTRRVAPLRNFGWREGLNQRPWSS